MGKRIKSTGIILDASSTGSAPVSPAGTVALRAKSDSTQFQYSANGGAWTDFTGGGGGSTPRLDQVLDPNIPATEPPTNRVKTFSMTDHSLVFGYTATQSEECFVIVSTEPVTPGAAGSLLLIQAQGATTEKSPLRIETRGVFALTVTPQGRVAIGAETDIGDRLNVYQTNSGTDTVGIFHAGCSMGAGSTANSIVASSIELADGQSTAALTSMQVMELEMSRTGGVANTGVTGTVLTLNTNLNVTTKTIRGLTVSLACVGTMTLTDWEAIRVPAPSTVGSPTITNRRAIITAANAGNVGFGTLTPAVQLHVAGGVQVDQTAGQTIAMYKAVDSGESVVEHFFKARGTLTSPTNIASGDTTGATIYYGRLSGSYTQLGYIRNRYDSTLGGITEIGAGLVDQSRVAITETGSIGSVTLYGGASNYFQVQTSGFKFSHGATGSTYYRDASGYFVDLAIGTVTQVLTVTDIGGGVLLPRWAAAAGGGGSGTPGGSATELQYRAGASTFGGITGSSVSGANVTLGGVLTLSAATALNHIIQKTSHVATGTEVGRLVFRGDRSGTPTDFGYIRAYWNDTSSNNATIEIGKSSTAFIGVSEVVTHMQFGSYSLQIQAGGIVVSTGVNSGVFYQNTGGALVATAAGTSSQYLKGGTAPSWGSLDASHVTAGTLAIARGGTGSTSTPANGQLLIGNGSGYSVATLTQGSNVTITNGVGTITIASTGGGGSTTPGGSSGEIQYNNAGGFGGITSSSFTSGTPGALYFPTTLSIQPTTSSTTGMQVGFTLAEMTSGTAAAGFGARYQIQLESDAGVARFAGSWDTRWQVAADSTRSAVMALRTNEKGANTLIERVVFGGLLDIADNTLTNLFSVTFAAADQKVVGGEIHMLITAKQVSGSIQTQVYHRKMHFVFGHNGATNSSAVDIRLDSGVGTNQVASSGGFSLLQHAINSSSVVDMTTAITLGTLSDVLTYKVLFNSDITTFSQFTVYYHIIYHGEADITLA